MARDRNPIYLRPYVRMGVAGVMICGALLLQSLPILRAFENIVYDWRVRFMLPTRQPTPEIVIIGIDDESLERMEPAVRRWPWPRFVHGLMIQYCRGAKVIGVDLLFPERQWQLWADDPGDDAIVRAARENGNVVFAAYFTDHPTEVPAGPALRAMALPMEAPGMLMAFDGVMPPFEALRKACRGMGHANLVRDEDGKMRRYLALLSWRGRAYPSLALALVGQYLDLDLRQIRLEPDGALHLGEERTIFADEQGAFRFQPYPGRYTYYSAVDVVDSWNAEAAGRRPLIGRDTFQDKIVLIGITAATVRDHEITSLKDAVPGVVITANAAQNMLEGVSFPPVPRWTNVALVSVMALFLALPLFDEPRPLFVAAIGAMICYGLFAVVAAHSMTWMIPVVGPVLSVTLTSAGLGGLYWAAERSRRRYLEALESAKQQFTDMLVHDLKNTMAPIVMMLSVVDAADDEDAAELGGVGPTFWRKDFPEIVSTSSKKLMTQINALLDIRRMEVGKLKLKPEPRSASALVREAQEEYRVVGERTELTIHAECGAPDDVRIAVDPEVFHRVLGNLIWNAIKHARQHSIIEIGTRPVENGVVQCYVSNEGKIIAKEMQERLFSAFMSGDPGARGERIPSTGLGLTFCKLAVEAHGGTIELLSPRPGCEDGVEVRLGFTESPA